MAVSGYLDLPILPCGRYVEELWERLDRLPADRHARRCPHCQAASGGLHALREATRGLARQRIEPAPDLTRRIMAAVRAEVRRGRDLPLPTGGGSATIGESAVAAVLRFAADQTPGVRARGCRIEAVPEQPGRIRVRLGLAVRYGLAVDEAVAVTRPNLTAVAEAFLGLTIDRVDIVVEDVLTESGDGKPR
jgi:hypothetical protein